MDEDKLEVVEKIVIAGRVFIPKESVKSEAELWEEKYAYGEEKVKKYIEQQEQERLESIRKERRCKTCRCYCGCHPCKHTKLSTKNK